MHEVSIIENVIKIVEDKAKENNLKKINNVSLKIGEMSGVMEDSLRFAFDCASKDTIMEDANLLIEKIEATGGCRSCGITFKIDHFNKLCPQCKKFCDNILSGYELYINTIQGD